MLMGMLRNWKPCTLLAVNSPVTVENSLVVPEKVKKQNYHMISQFHA